MGTVDFLLHNIPPKKVKGASDITRLGGGRVKNKILAKPRIDWNIFTLLLYHKNTIMSMVLV